MAEPKPPDSPHKLLLSLVLLAIGGLGWERCATGSTAGSTAFSVAGGVLVLLLTPFVALALVRATWRIAVLSPAATTTETRTFAAFGVAWALALAGVAAASDEPQARVVQALGALAIVWAIFLVVWVVRARIGSQADWHRTLRSAQYIGAGRLEVAERIMAGVRDPAAMPPSVRQTYDNNRALLATFRGEHESARAIADEVLAREAARVGEPRLEGAAMFRHLAISSRLALRRADEAAALIDSAPPAPPWLRLTEWSDRLRLRRLRGGPLATGPELDELARTTLDRAQNVPHVLLLLAAEALEAAGREGEARATRARGAELLRRRPWTARATPDLDDLVGPALAA